MIRNLLFIITLLYTWQPIVAASQIQDYKLSDPILASDNVSSDLVISPTQDRVIYAVEDGQRSNRKHKLFISNTDGEGEVVRLAPNLTTGFFTERVIFSRDGSKVAFIYDTGTGFPFNNFAYYVAPVDGGDAVLIDDQIDSVNIGLGVSFEFNDDGTALFYISATNDRTNGLFKRGVRAELPRQRLDTLDEEFSNVAADFVFTSDKSGIIYVAYGGDSQLLLVSVTGGPSRRLDEAGIEGDFVYSSSQERVIYFARSAVSGDLNLFSASIDDLNDRVKLNQGLSPGVLPFGRVLLASNQTKAIFQAGVNKLFVVSLDGSGLIDLSQWLASDQSINGYVVSSTKNFVIIEAIRVNDPRQPQFLVEFDNPLMPRLVSPNERPIGDLVFASDERHILYKQLLSAGGSDFDSRFYISDLSSGRADLLELPNNLSIDFFDSFGFFGGSNAIYRAVNGDGERNLYLTTLRGQRTIQLNRNLALVNSSGASQSVQSFALLSSQNRLIYVGNTDLQNNRELFALDFSEQIVQSDAIEELCFPISALDGSVSVVCL